MVSHDQYPNMFLDYSNSYFYQIDFQSILISMEYQHHVVILI